MPNIKRALALLLTLATLLSALPFTALAAEDVETGAVAEQNEISAEAADPQEPVEESPAADDADLAGESASEITAAPVEETGSENAASPVEGTVDDKPAAIEESAPVEESAPAEESVPAEEAPVAQQAAPAEEAASVEAVQAESGDARRALAGTSTGNAPEIKMGQEVDGLFAETGDSSNLDYYKFTLASSGAITIKGSSKAGDVSLRLLNGNNKSIWSKSMVNLSEATTLDLTKDTYYLVIGKAENSGTYTFTVSFASAGETAAETGSGSNNDPKTASKLKMDTEVVGQISLTDSVDYYSFVLSKPSRIQFTSVTKMEALDFSIMEYNGSEVWSVLTEKDRQSGENKATKSIDLIAGTYYLKVTKKGDTGIYKFLMNATAVNETFPDAIGSTNNTLSRAVNIGANLTYKGQLAVNDSVDYYKFTVSDDKAKIVLTAVLQIPQATFTVRAANSDYRRTTSATKSDSVKESFDLSRGTYYLIVEAPAGYTGTYTGTYSFKLTSKQLFVPEITRIENLNGGIRLSWNNNNAEKYRVFVRLMNRWESLGDVTGTSYTYRKVSHNQSYTFTIRCVSKDGKRFTSQYDPKGKSITYIAAPSDIQVININNGVKVTWRKVSGVSRYRVFYRIGKGSWVRCGDSTSTTMSVYDLKNNTDYTFTVRALSSDGKQYISGYDWMGKTITYLQAPNLTKVYANNGGIRLVWDKVPGAAKYRVFYRTATDSWIKCADTTDTTMLVTKLKTGNTYRFTVRCISSDVKAYTSSYNPTGKTLTYLPAPEFSKPQEITGGIRLSWKSVKGAERYRIYYRTKDKDWTRLDDTTTTSYNVTNMDIKTTYYFTVRCMTSDGKAYASNYKSIQSYTTK